MGRVSEPAPDAELVDVVRLWRVDPRAHVEDLVHAVNATLSEVEITGSESFKELDDVATRLEESLGVESLTGSELQDAAVAGMCRRLESGDVTPRELTYWVTRVIGWRGSVRTQPLLDLEQEYCNLPLTDEEVTALDVRVRTAARDFLLEPEAAEVRPKRGRVRRLLRRSGSGAPKR